MPVSRLRQPPSAHRRASAALMGVGLLQAVFVPLLPRATEIPYSEFTAIWNALRA